MLKGSGLTMGSLTYWYEISMAKHIRPNLTAMVGKLTHIQGTFPLGYSQFVG
jgi:hypothetical protein